MPSPQEAKPPRKKRPTPHRKSTAEKEDEEQDRLIFGPPKNKLTPKGKSSPYFEINCSCGYPRESRPIVCCKYVTCLRKFFHADCAGLPSNQNSWACEECKEQRNDQKQLTRITILDIEGPSLSPTVARGPGGDVYGLDSWREETGPPQYAVLPATELNAIGRIKRKAEQEKDLLAVRMWTAEVDDLDEVEWDWKGSEEEDGMA